MNRRDADDDGAWIDVWMDDCLRVRIDLLLCCIG